MEPGEIKHNKKCHRKGKTRKSQWLLFHSSYWWNPGWQVQLRLLDLRVKKVPWIDQSPTLGGTFLTIIFYSSRFALCEVLSVQCTQVMPSEAMFQFTFQMKDCSSKSLLPPGTRLPDCGLFYRLLSPRSLQHSLWWVCNIISMKTYKASDPFASCHSHVSVATQ